MIYPLIIFSLQGMNLQGWLFASRRYRRLRQSKDASDAKQFDFLQLLQVLKLLLGRKLTFEFTLAKVVSLILIIVII